MGLSYNGILYLALNQKDVGSSPTRLTRPRLRGHLIGRIADFDSVHLGSNPSPSAILNIILSFDVARMITQGKTSVKSARLSVGSMNTHEVYRIVYVAWGHR